MPRPLDLRPAGRVRDGAGAPAPRVLVAAVLLQLVAALVVLLVAPGRPASGSLRVVAPPPAAALGPAPPPSTGAPDERPVDRVPAEDAGAGGAGHAAPSSGPSPLVLPAQAARPGGELSLVLRSAAAPGPSSAPSAGEAGTAAAARTAAVRELLERRGAALLARDEQAFLSVVDPAAAQLRSRQAALFDALEQVPLSTWEYSLDPSVPHVPDSRLDRRYGAGRWWAPGVLLEVALAGVDDRPTSTVQHLTFVERDGRWLLAADDDFAATGLTARRALWDAGPVVAERADDVLVLGRPADRPLLREVAETTAAAVPRVSAAWGPDWRRSVVVLVPGSGQELAELMGTDDDLSRIAGVAVAELGDPELAQPPTGERILLNPGVFAGLSPSGRQLVLTHELTHVATRWATGPAVPMWLAEGYADHVGYSGLSVPLSVSAAALQADVRAGQLPDRLPADVDFTGANPALAQAYEQAWLAVELLSEQYGPDGLLRFYRAVGRDPEPEGAVDRALRSELGTTTAQLTADWRAALQRDLG